MCGIFGVIPGAAGAAARDIKPLVSRIFLLSESRGREASGICLISDDEFVVCKENIPAHALVASPAYDSLFRRPAREDGSLPSPARAYIGHSRLVTNGSQELYDNNQPVVKNGGVIIHNGIVVNDAELWGRHPGLTRSFEIDTEVILDLLTEHHGELRSLEFAVAATYDELRGTAAIAAVPAGSGTLVLATNNGSLYLAHKPGAPLVFASEQYFLARMMSDGQLAGYTVEPVAARSGWLVDLTTGARTAFEFSVSVSTHTASGTRHERTVTYLRAGGTMMDERRTHPAPAPLIPQSVKEHVRRCEEAVAQLRRCSRCLLPETIPFITFDDAGVCNVCTNYRRHVVHGADVLAREADALRSPRAQHDCIIAVSGGRDSSYGLHYIVKELGLRPLAYTYDWGMVTDLARRNIARLCGELGVEHVIISADIARKRSNIRKNVLAWLRKPVMGLIPLFMAGDKQFFWYVNQLKKHYGISKDVWCFNIHEKADFKEELSGIRMWDYSKDFDKRVAVELKASKSIQLALYYGMEFLKNPGYLNSSLWDTFFAYLSYYFVKKDYLSLFDYLAWDEGVIERTIIDGYGWELAPDTRTTWRIGDGTAAFYNYIYHTVCGYTENDWFRSNQIREGMLTREKALELVMDENRPRWESILWYCDTISIDPIAALETINAIPKHHRV